jgi:hypothetical protein
MRAPLFILPALLLSTLAATPAHADQVYWSTEALLKDFFRTSERVSYVKVETDPAKDVLKASLGYVPGKTSFVVFVAHSGSKVDGYAVIDDEPGEHLPITFGVKLSPEGVVERMEVMVYREGYGGEVREPRFRDQFVGKRSNDKIRFGDDVAAISGATISSKAMATGVRRAVALVAIARGKSIDASASAAR